MRKFSIIGHYFITPGRYSCPGVSPARGGWPWNAGNAPVCGGAGEGRESEGRFREQWFRRWFREWFRELVVAGMVSRPVPGGGSRMVSGGVGASESRFRGRWFRNAFEVGAGAGAGVCVISGVVPGVISRMFPEWFRSGSGADAGEVSGGGFGGVYGHGGRPSHGDVRAGWFGAAGSGPGKGVYGFFGREVCLNHTVCC